MIPPTQKCRKNAKREFLSPPPTGLPPKPSEAVSAGRRRCSGVSEFSSAAATEMSDMQRVPPTASIAFVWSAAKLLPCQTHRAGHGPAPHFRAEAHTHSKLRAFLRKRFYPPPAAQLQRGTSPPLRNPQLSEGTREIISERSLIMKKDIKFSTRMASADREKIRALAAKAHMSMSDYVTTCCLGKRIMVIDEQKELLRQIKGIGSNINRLTVLANMDKVQVIGLEKAAGELSEVSAALRAVMEGR